MKKAFYIGLISYIIAAFILIITRPNPSEDLLIMTLKKQYTRVITEDEKIDIGIYISEEKSFLVDTSLISSAALHDELQYLSVEIIEVKNAYHKVIIDEQIYYLFYFSLSFNKTAFYNDSLSLENAFLKIGYEHEVDLNFEIGSVYLLFQTDQNYNHLSLNRMFGIINIVDDIEIVRGIYIELESKEPSIILKSISFLNPLLTSNVKHVKSGLDIPTYNTNYYDIDSDIELTVNEEATPYKLDISGDNAFIIPVQYINDIFYINRFPVIIHYQLQGEDYSFIIDDFLFFNDVLEIQYYEQRTYHYQYT